MGWGWGCVSLNCAVVSDVMSMCSVSVKFSMSRDLVSAL